jgi:hypothetical protein
MPEPGQILGDTKMYTLTSHFSSSFTHNRTLPRNSGVYFEVVATGATDWRIDDVVSKLVQARKIHAVL